MTDGEGNLLMNVAPHAGSVDRNFSGLSAGRTKCRSLPTRGAWIEILDTNGAAYNGDDRRSPRGERG